MQEATFIQIQLKSSASNKLTLQVRFDEVSDPILNKLTNEKYIEATLINLYAKQLEATMEWEKENGLLLFTLSFQKSEKKGSSSILRNTE